ncbi:CorA Metal Ion Transporter (MIT) Family [Achlya hypogyna]|uniref:Magnesium transporter n=1 Tax=Achlya hypogyna TaxID=1202772 RepID=A0A1V9YU79_ACHHY|nr:CorA Metal Ion Transporter (MIT) Family [Achlya hypogyna]
MRKRQPNSVMSSEAYTNDDFDGVGTAMSNGKRMALAFDPTGNCTQIYVTRSEILKLVELAAAVPAPSTSTSLPQKLNIPRMHVRDLRKLDNVFSVTNEPVISVRQQAVLVNIDPVRAVILRDSCYVFLPRDAFDLAATVKVGFQAQVSSQTPFELGAIKAVMQITTQVLTEDIQYVLPEAAACVSRLGKENQSQLDVERLRTLKNEMNAMNSRVESLRRMLMVILDNEDDMCMMQLTAIHHSSGRDVLSTNNLENIFETFLHDLYAMQNQVSLMLHRVHDMEDMTMLKLQTRRNYLLLMDVALTMAATFVAVPNFVVGGFGMNLDSTVQLTPYMFWIVFGVCIFFPIAGFMLTKHYMHRQGLNLF